MRTGEAFRVALEALRANRLRSALTMLGVVIGVAAVVVLVAIGSGAKQEVEDQVEGLGSNIIIVVPGKFELGVGAVGEPAAARRRATARPGRRRRAPRWRCRSRRGRSCGSGAARPSPRSTGPTRTCPTSSTGRWRAATYITVVRRRHPPARRRARLATVARQVFGDVDPLGRQVSIAGGAVPGHRRLRAGRLDVRRRPGRRGAHPGHRGAAAVRGRPDRRPGRQGATRRRRRAAAARADSGPAGQVRRGGVLRGDPDPDPRDHRPDPRPAHPGAGRHRRDLAAGRRCRGVQHHAGQRP